MTIAMYVRVSNQRHGQTQSIEQQVERLRLRAAELGAASTEGGALGVAESAAVQLFRDEGYSGATLRRPGLDALRDAVAAAVNRVLITAPDRLARNYVHQVLLLEELERFGCVVEFLDRPMSHDPHDQLLLQIRGAVAEYERTLIVERMRRGRLAKFHAGTLLPWTRVPYGLSVDPDRPRDPSGVTIDPVAGAHVHELFLGYLEERATVGQLVATLERQGVPTPHGGRHWNRSTVRWLLSNPVYMGQVFAGRTRTYPAGRRRSALHPVGERSAHLELADRPEWMLVTTIPAIVSADVFDRVQVKLAENRRLARRHTTTGEYLLRALVSCGVCGYACTGRQEKPRYAYYLCAGKAAAGSSGLHLPKSLGEHCPARYIPVRVLDGVVWRDLCEVLTHPDSLAHALQRSLAGAWLPQELQARRVQLQQGLRQLDHQLQRLGDAYQADVMPLAEYRQRRTALERQQVVLQQRQEQLETQVDQQQALAQVTTSLTDFCARVQAGLAHATFGQRRQLVELLIDRVVVTDGDVEIHYVLPTTPASEHVRFSHLRTNYQHRLPGREVRGEIAPGASRAQHVEDGVEDAAQRVGARSAACRQRRERALDAGPLGVRQVARIRRTHTEQRTASCHFLAYPKHALNVLARSGWQPRQPI